MVNNGIKRLDNVSFAISDNTVSENEALDIFCESIYLLLNTKASEEVAA